MTWKNGMAILALGVLLSCAGTPPSDLGVGDDGLRLCPESPNCVSSRDTDEVHAIAQCCLFVLTGQHADKISHAQWQETLRNAHVDLDLSDKIILPRMQQPPDTNL